MDDTSQLDDNSKVCNEYSISLDHFEWEKQYLKIYFSQATFEMDEKKRMEKTFEEFLKKIFPLYQSQESGLRFKQFLTYLQNKRDLDIEFEGEEKKIVENDEEFKSLLIAFHQSISTSYQYLEILIQIDQKKEKDDSFINYFQNLDQNIKCSLCVQLEDLLGHIYWNEKVQQIQKFFNQDELKLAKETYQKQKKIQNNKNCYTILIIGAVGTGKSKLAQELSWKLSGSKNKQQFKDGDDLDGVTKDLTRQQLQYSDTVIDLIDTPGCGDMDKGLQFVFNELTSNSIKIDLIIFCMNAQIIRLHRQDLCFLSIIQGIFKCNWDAFHICLNFMEQYDKEQIKSQSLVSSFEKRLEIKLPEQNLIIEQDYSEKIQRIQNIIDQSIKDKSKNSFTLRYVPAYTFIHKRLKQYQA